MNVLQLCYKPPFPPVDGGTQAMHSLTKGMLAQGCKVKVLSVCSAKHPVQLTGAEGESYRQATGFEAVELDLGVKPLPAAAALLCGESYNVKRFESRAFKEKLTAVLQAEEYDVVQVESIFLAPYLETIRQHSRAKVVLRAHNVEHRIWRQMALGERNALKRWYLKKLALALRAYELERINLFDGVACITDDDLAVFKAEGCRKPMITIPFGIELPPCPATEAAPNTLYYLGAMDWRPNQEGVDWFVEQVWPLVHSALPQLTFHVAGRRTPAEAAARWNAMEGIVADGEVPDAAEYVGRHWVNVVPLLSGSGMRIKIIEAMAHGKAVVSTTLGAQGIHCQDGTHLLLADTPEEFVKALQRLCEEPGLAARLGENARRLVAEEYGCEAMARKLTDLYLGIEN